MAKTYSLIATAPYVGKHATAALGEVLEVSAIIAAVLLRTGKFRFHTPVVLESVQSEPATRRRRTYRRRDMAAE